MDLNISTDIKKPKNAIKGKKFSENHRINLQNAICKHKGKKVYQYDINYNFIKEYPSILTTEKVNNFKQNKLRRKIDNKTPFEGFYWLTTKI